MNKIKTDQILSVMHVLAWITFIGLMIETGALFSTYIISSIKSEWANRLYNSQHISELLTFSFWHYSVMILTLVILNALKAYSAYVVIQVLSKINLENPFTEVVAKLLERISYLLLDVWIISVIYNAHRSWLLKRIDLNIDKLSLEFIFVVGVVFIIAQIFKKGVALQSENELTI